MDTQFSESYRRHINMRNPLWRLIRIVAMVLSCGRDCVNPFLKANQIDHVNYRSLKQTVPIEIPWIDVVPLHPATHRLVTRLRAAGYKTPVDIVLRFGYGMWILAWVYTISLTIAIVHGSHLVPTPLDIGRDILGLMKSNAR
jgi:hypothetical protein